MSQSGTLQGVALTDYLSKLPQKHKPGTVFNYNTAESVCWGRPRALSATLPLTMNAKIWQGFGMEHARTGFSPLPLRARPVALYQRVYSDCAVFVKNGGVTPREVDTSGKLDE